ncbi:MAG: MaoC family dehydratase [Anaerolineales bacterium]|nr:MaoC family dehydratase [Chloroflexota bacterium]MBL6982328.1 MaoC family dehydratase [Anaerolineales bacterium]
MIVAGDSASRTKTFSDEDVRSFANISGDNNPIHLDDEYAAGTQFGQRLVHGILTSGLISAVLGTQLPGPGSVYIKQTINFRAPVYIGDTITATVTAKKIREDKPIATFETVCKNEAGKVVINGEAVLLLPTE